MNIQKVELPALAAYLKLIQSKGATADNLAKRKDFIGKVMRLLEGKPVDGLSYRTAIDQALLQISRDEWPFFLAVSREYYYFWVDDFKAIAALNSRGDFMVEPVSGALHGEENLEQAWERLDHEKFDVAEIWPLQAYKAALREEGAGQSVVDTREQLVKLLLIDLRNAPDKSGKSYRMAVDSLQPMFVMHEMRCLFLTVVREFYYFWIGAPDAASHIVLHKTG